MASVNTLPAEFHGTKSSGKAVFPRVLLAELIKLRSWTTAGALVWGPLLVAFAAFVFCSSSRFTGSWFHIFVGSLQIWTVFLYPMMVTVLVAHLAQLEQNSGGWLFLMSLPIQRSKILGVKALVAVGLSLAMQTLYLGLIAIAARLGSAWSGHDLGSANPVTLANAFFVIWGAGLPMTAIQFWASCRARSFAVPMIIGIGGTLLNVATLIFPRAEARFSPWALPHQILNWPGIDVPSTLGIAVLAGLAIFALAIADLARRDWA